VARSASSARPRSSLRPLAEASRQSATPSGERSLNTTRSRSVSALKSTRSSSPKRDACQCLAPAPSSGACRSTTSSGDGDGGDDGDDDGDDDGGEDDDEEEEEKEEDEEEEEEEEVGAGEGDSELSQAERLAGAEILARRASLALTGSTTTPSPSPPALPREARSCAAPFFATKAHTCESERSATSKVTTTEARVQSNFRPRWLSRNVCNV